jgi:hypothetical protein
MLTNFRLPTIGLNRPFSRKKGAPDFFLSLRQISESPQFSPLFSFRVFPRGRFSHPFRAAQHPTFASVTKLPKGVDIELAGGIGLLLTGGSRSLTTPSPAPLVAPASRAGRFCTAGILPAISLPFSAVIALGLPADAKRTIAGRRLTRGKFPRLPISMTACLL